MKMRHPFLLLAALLSVSLAASGATYYVSSFAGNDNYSFTQAQSQATPWRTLAKVNSFFGSIKPGDQILLQAGSAFAGPLLVTRSGSVTQPVTISVYGTGNMPIITGFVNLSGWVSAGGGIWQAPCTGCGPRVNMLAVANVSQPMGRYPNTNTANKGYLTVQSFSGTTSFTDSHLGGNWTGAELVIRKNNWVIERDPILSQTGHTINYVTSTVFTPTIKYGYFIQNSVSTLDQNNEWYYDPGAKKMNFYSMVNPSGTLVQASAIDTLANFKNVQFVVLNGIYLQGANKTAISIMNSNFITVSNCIIKFSGVDGIDVAGTSTNANIGSVVVDYSNNDGIFVTANNNTIQNCTVQRTGTFPGMGIPELSYQGITVNGNSNTIQYNVVDTTGYTGIEFTGVQNTIKNNFVNYFCFVKDDGGGIYTWSGNLDSNAEKNTGWVTSNIVTNGITNPAGTDSVTAGIAHGIYLDENTTECYVTGNTVTHCSAGVFFQDTRNIAVQNNTLYDNAGQIIIRHASLAGNFKGNDVSNNFAVSNVDTENVMVISSVGPSSAIPSFAYMHNNRYAQVISGSTFFHISASDINTTGNYGRWQSTFGQDLAYSTLLPLNFLPYTINSLIGSDLFTKGAITTPFQQAPVGTRVVASTAIGPLISGAWYVTSFTMAAPDNAHTMLVFLQQNVAAYLLLTPVISVPTAAPSNNNTVAFQTTGATAFGGLAFQIQQSDPRIAVSNITLYQANVTPNNPDQNVIFQYNASKSTLPMTLIGVYQDAAGTLYQGTVQIPAYGSLLLFKKT